MQAVWLAKKKAPNKLAVQDGRLRRPNKAAEQGKAAKGRESFSIRLWNPLFNQDFAIGDGYIVAPEQLVHHDSRQGSQSVDTLVEYFRERRGTHQPVMMHEAKRENNSASKTEEQALYKEGEAEYVAFGHAVKAAAVRPSVPTLPSTSGTRVARGSPSSSEGVMDQTRSPEAGGSPKEKPHHHPSWIFGTARWTKKGEILFSYTDESGNEQRHKTSAQSWQLDFESGKMIWVSKTVQKTFVCEKW
ncbi:hypothetical protein NLG97_g3804 [Lecanicillium saksenae]|uniref:Uncharacterized protein n=1 Tax=Lecanicillium saksenae TaxID=468837 RepID=A0ACC1QYU3_9HYPO|nr:hypothetical protein NLG97_g3804 [Lecanicillium saksenae]